MKIQVENEEEKDEEGNLWTRKSRVIMGWGNTIL